MGIARVGRGLASPLLAVNFVVYLVILGLAGWSLDKYINGEQNHLHLGGNPSTSFLLIFALISEVIGLCSVMSGSIPLRAWRSDSLAVASSLAIISCSITALAFGKHGKYSEIIRVNVSNEEFQQNTGSICYNLPAKSVAVFGTSPC